MKKRLIGIIFVLVLVFAVGVAAGCDHVHQFASKYKFDDNTHWKECSCGEKENVGRHTFDQWYTLDGKKYADCTYCGYTKEIADEREVEFYAINDFHGKWERMSTVGGYLVENRNKNPNTLFINSGDMFQGSMESNSNYGALLSECMDDIGFDAFTFGNHEFDWGLDNLMNLAKNSRVPFLGANIYHWNADTKKFGTFASELAQEYVVKTLDNGLKIGIIGVIGKDQITSISSQLVQTIGFKDPKEVVPSLSDKLKNELYCDVVVVSAHTGPDTFLKDNSWDITQYADAVFCAHTHKQEVSIKNGVPFVQGGSSGSHVSHVTLKVSPTGNVSCQLYTNVPYSSSWANLYSIAEKINNSNDKIADEANQVLSTANGYLSRYGEIPRIVCNAIADYAVANYPQTPIALAMVNDARNNIGGGTITYTQLYEALPFDNTVYIAKVRGWDILNEASYGNYIWRVTGEAINGNNYYYIAVIDYLLFHQNSDRDYNYFRSAFQSGFEPIPIENDKYAAGTFNYRIITRDWMLSKQADGSIINVADYTDYNANTNVDLLTQNVTFDGGSNLVVEHSGTIYDPYTVADATILARGVTDAAYAMEGYLKATVTSVNEAVFSTLDGSVRKVYVSDSEGNSLQLYWIRKSEDVADYWNQNDFELHVGDEVVLYGKFITYNGTVEITDGYCVSINGTSSAYYANIGLSVAILPSVCNGKLWGGVQA